MSDLDILIRAMFRLGRFFLTSVAFSALVATCVILYLKGKYLIVLGILVVAVIALGFGVCFYMEKSLSNEELGKCEKLNTY